MKEVRKSPFIGIGLDESTDKGKRKHVVFVIRYCADTTKLRPSRMAGP